MQKSVIRLTIYVLVAVAITTVLLTSCSSSKVVYEKGMDRWSPKGKYSTMTGWSYQTK